MKTYTEKEIRNIITSCVRDAYEGGAWNSDHTYRLGYSYRLGYNFNSETFEELSLTEHYISGDDGFVVGDISAEYWTDSASDEDLTEDNLDDTIDAYLDGESDHIEEMIETCREWGIIEDGVEEQTWYAIEVDEDDNDWGTGSFEYDEAVKMLRETAEHHPDARIAVIKIDQYDSVCDRIITLADLG